VAHQRSISRIVFHQKNIDIDGVHRRRSVIGEFQARKSEHSNLV
jgi:hypothetical protein